MLCQFSFLVSKGFCFLLSKLYAVLYFNIHIQTYLDLPYYMYKYYNSKIYSSIIQDYQGHLRYY